MTNKEKAREIAGGLNFPISGYESGEYDGALEMAKWKDQQFKDYLVDKGADYEIEAITNPSVCEKANVINEILNELFPEDDEDTTDNDE